jgi:hypothetical protein
MQVLTDAAKAFILQRMARGDPLWRIAASVQANFHIEIDSGQVLACWRDSIASPTQIAPGPEHVTTTEPGPESATTTEPRPENATTTEPGPDSATTTQPRQDGEPMATLTDEIKEFIVRGLARYETPLQVAASVKAHFGVEITRQQVHEYNPMNSRPPASRWCELHAVTREKFLNDVAAIGVAQKVVRLRLLDHFTQRAIDNNSPHRAAEFMEQAAKECGGFYERRRKSPAARDVPSNGTGL